MLNKSEDAAGHSYAAQMPLWLEFNAEDLTVVDVVELLEGMKAADACGLAQALRVKVPHLARDALGRVTAAILAVCEIRMVSPWKIDPYGPLAVFPDGRRTTIPSDFGSIVGPLVELLSKTTHPVLKARVADVCWIVERKRTDVGRVAAAAYLATFDSVQQRELEFDFDIDPVLSSPEALQCVQRALVIGGAKGVGEAAHEEAKSYFKNIYAQVYESRDLGAAQRLARIDLEHSLTPPASLALDLESLAREAVTAEKFFSQVQLYRLAVRAYLRADDVTGADRCRLSISERLELEADKRLSPMHAASELSDAISALHGISGVKERRRALRHKLADVQANIPDEMHVFSHSEDLTDEIKQVRDECCQKKGLFEKLLSLVSLARAQSSKELSEQAKEILRDSSIFSLMGTSYFDDAGRLVARTPSWNEEDGNETGVVAHSIAKNESHRRNFAHIFMQWVRLDIISSHYVSEDALTRILYLSPFVPRDKLKSYVRGFACFFSGDFVSALSVLTPLLEPSVLHVLKMNSCDVTKFDDATQVEQDKTISKLVEQNRADLNAVFGEALVNDIDGVFLNIWGPKIRHSVAHGLIGDGEHAGPDAIYAMVLILRLCIFPLRKHKDKIQEMCADL